MYIQDTTSTVSRPQRIGAVALFLAAVSATTTFAAPAHAHQEIHGGASSASTTAKDIVDFVTERKKRMARDRIERAWLYD